jgi:hypothetical protein
MLWWILEERDRYLRSGDHACFFEQLEPLVLEASTATCPRCGSLLEPAIWQPPCKARVSSRTCGDLIQGAAFELVVSTAVHKAFLDDGLSGLVSFHALEPHPRLPNSYVVARPRVTPTGLDENRSGVRWRRPPTCELCRLGVRESVERVVIREANWDGSDIFMASGFYGAKIVTKRFVDWVNDHGFTNFRFIPSEEYADTLGSIPKQRGDNGSS